jgi:hypothetical protein
MDDKGMKPYTARRGSFLPFIDVKRIAASGSTDASEATNEHNSAINEGKDESQACETHEASKDAGDKKGNYISISKKDKVCKS